MIKGSKAEQQLALICFTVGVAFCTPISWFIFDLYNNRLDSSAMGFKLFFTLLHLACGVFLLALSMLINANIDRKENENALVSKS